MDNLQPTVLFGMTTKDLWPYIHPIALCGWTILCLLPRWEYTMQLVLIPPLIEAVLYAILLISMMIFPSDPNEPPPDINSMESIFGLFQKPDVFFVGWVHYLVFDLLIARGLAMDAIDTCNVSYPTYYLLVVPCLLMTFYMGPVGFVMYMILRTTVLSPKPAAAAVASKKKS